MGEATKRQIPGYKLLSRLGAGGQASVYKAVQISMNRPVAVKVIAPDKAAGTTELSRFMREARVLAQLRHENIVQAIDYGEADGFRFLVMEFVEGSTVLDLIEKRGALGLTQSAEITLSICRALEHARKFGVLHRDIKPENIVITKEGRAVLVDFGLARATGTDFEVTMAGTAIGTPHYMAPEQILGRDELDHRVDIYALGATLFHMLTGCVPFPCETRAEVLTSHLSVEVEIPADLVDLVPERVMSVVWRAMQKDRKQRYDSAEEMMLDLVSALGEVRRPARKVEAAAPSVDDERVAELTRERDLLLTENERLLVRVERLRREAVELRGEISRLKVRGKTPRGASRVGKESPSTTSDTVEMLAVAAGLVILGEDQGAHVDRPRREVELDAFLIDLHPVTNAQYQVFVRDTGRSPPTHWPGGTPPPALLKHPVVEISWMDASAYAAWCGKRLPSAWEWQRAARGTDGRLFPWGDEADPVRCNCKERGLGRTTPVGLFKQDVSPTGMKEAAGNVAEWVDGKSEAEDGVLLRPACGGSFKDPLSRACCASLRGYPDGGKAPHVGFRCARDASSE